MKKDLEKAAGGVNYKGPGFTDKEGNTYTRNKTTERDGYCDMFFGKQSAASGERVCRNCIYFVETAGNTYCTL